MTVPANHEPADCYICHRMAIGLGMGDGRDPKWICTECAVLVGDIRKVRTFNAYEHVALAECGDSGGEYLQTLDQFDIRELYPAQYEEFCKRIIHGFGDSIRKQIRNHKAPF